MKGMLGWKGVVGSMFMLLLLTGCNSVKGDYTCDGGLMDSMRLEGGGKAYVTIMFLGQKSEQAGTYTVDGDKVTVTIGPGQTTVFTRTDKVLDGGTMVGKCTPK